MLTTSPFHACLLLYHVVGYLYFTQEEEAVTEMSLELVN